MSSEQKCYFCVEKNFRKMDKFEQIFLESGTGPSKEEGVIFETRFLLRLQTVSAISKMVRFCIILA